MKQNNCAIALAFLLKNMTDISRTSEHCGIGDFQAFCTYLVEDVIPFAERHWYKQVAHGNETIKYYQFYGIELADQIECHTPQNKAQWRKLIMSVVDGFK